MTSSFANRMVEARKAYRLTQNMVAERLEVSAQAVSSWERGETMPDIMKLPEIAEMYGVTVDWLLSEKGVEEEILDVTEHMSDRLFDEERMYTYVKTYATIKGMAQTLRVLPYVRELHKEQERGGKDHVPYVYHPLMVACHALALGLDEDDLISAALLHDVCEDCGVKPAELPVNEATREAVERLTKDEKYKRDPEAHTQEYYDRIAENRIAVVIKILDRCNNVSGMAAAFSSKRMARYIKETEKWIYPLFRRARIDYPELSNQMFLIKYHMTSVVETVKRQLR